MVHKAINTILESLLEFFFYIINLLFNFPNWDSFKKCFFKSNDDNDGDRHIE